MLKALRWALLPWWLVRLFSEEKSFEHNPLLDSHTLARRGLHVWRARLAQRISRWRRARLTHLVSQADRAALERYGVLAKRDFLPPDLFKALLAEVEGLSIRAGEFKEGDAITRRIPLTPELLERLPACRALLQTPEWRGLTRYVSSFDSEPLVFIQTIFSQVDDSRRDPQTDLHMDTFHPTMKAWLFLHDVAEEDGPLSYAPGSHRRTPRREAWERLRSIRITDPASVKKGGALRIGKAELARLRFPKPQRFAVPANTLVVGDTYGFHGRRRSTRPSTRLEIWAYSRRNPFLPWTGLDLSSQPGAKGRAVLISWLMIRLRRKLGLPAPVFRMVQVDGPQSPPQPWPEP